MGFGGNAVVAGYCCWEAVGYGEEVWWGSGWGVAICALWLVFDSIFMGAVCKIEQPVRIKEDVVWYWFEAFR